MKKNIVVIILAVCLGCTVMLGGCNDVVPAMPSQLIMNELSYDTATDTVYWTEVTGASGYAVSQESENAENIKTVTLAAEELEYKIDADKSGEYKITVTAMGDGISFTDSVAESLTVQYIVKLEMGNISYNNGSKTVSWEMIENAEYYLIDVNGRVNSIMKNYESFAEEAVSVYTVKVKAVGDQVNYRDSEWSNILNFEIIRVDEEVPLQELTMENIYYDEATETVSWEMIENAEYYLIDVNGRVYSTMKNYESFEGRPLSTYIVKVKAAGDGVNYADSGWSNILSFAIADKKAPVLSVGSISSEYSVRTAVRLPQATVRDDYDEKPAIMVHVEDPDGKPIYKAVTYEKEDYNGNKYTFVKEYETRIHEFNNTDEGTMIFYPHKTGVYKIVYWSYDNAGNGLKDKTGSLTSYQNAAHPALFIIDVTDRQAPHFLFTKEQVESIPKSWSIASESLTAAKIVFPLPLAIDNLNGSNADYMSEINEDGTPKTDFNIKMDLTIKNPNSKTVFRITNVYAEDSLFRTNGGKFAFSDIDGPDRILGDYTITYTVRDSANNVATKQFIISLIK